MPETLAVHLGREGRRSLEAPTSFEAHGPFEVALVNHGPSAHVYIQVDDTLARVAGVDADNYFVEEEGTRTVYVDVAPADEHVQGELSIATGYGAEAHTVTVDLQAPERRSVEVDDSLATPASTGTGSRRGIPHDWLVPVALGLLGIVALALAGGAYLFTEDPIVAAGSFVVVVAVLAAIAMVVR